MKLKFKQMKTRLLFLLFIAFTLGLEAQGDLQFSQVIGVDLYYPAEDAGWSNNNYMKVNEIQVTIPEGKIWKITSASIGYKNTLGEFDQSENIRDLIISIDNVVIYSVPSYTNISEGTEYIYPLWLGSGDYNFKLKYEATSASTDSSETLAKVIGIEFNVIQ